MAGMAVECTQRPGAGCAQQGLGEAKGIKAGRRLRAFRQSIRHRAGQRLCRFGLHRVSPKCFICHDFSQVCHNCAGCRASAGTGAGRVFARPIHARRPPMPTIALVDDDRNILTSVSIALESEGYRIMTYTDGASALEGFKTSPPDLAILDIKMPRMDGMELLRRLRQKTDMPVIFLTSKDEEIDELFGLKMGADDFIKKPFSQRLLVERVKSVLRRAA